MVIGNWCANDLMIAASIKPGFVHFASLISAASIKHSFTVVVNNFPDHRVKMIFLKVSKQIFPLSKSMTCHNLSETILDNESNIFNNCFYLSDCVKILIKLHLGHLIFLSC